MPHFRHWPMPAGSAQVGGKQPFVRRYEMALPKDYRGAGLPQAFPRTRHRVRSGLCVSEAEHIRPSSAHKAAAITS
jgi:hypothetical protein